MKSLWLALFCTLSLAVGVAAAPAEENVLQVGADGTDITTLDPIRATQTTDVVLVGWLYNGLVRFRPGSADPNDLEPDLAKSWETSADGKSWTFHLREGVKFHGQWGELTAADVVFSLTRAADPKRSTFASDFAGVESIAAIDDYTVRI